MRAVLAHWVKGKLTRVNRTCSNWQEVEVFVREFNAPADVYEGLVHLGCLNVHKGKVKKIPCKAHMGAGETQCNCLNDREWYPEEFK